MDKDIKKEIRYIIEDVFQKIKYGRIERGWEVYEEFKQQLQKLL